MDIFLNFKSKLHADKYHENLELTTSKMVALGVFTCLGNLPFVPATQIMRYKAGNDLSIIIKRILMICIYDLALLIIGLIARWKRKWLEKYRKTALWSIDLLYNGCAYYQMTIMYEGQGLANDPVQKYMAGWLHCLTITVLLLAISRWYLRVSGFLILIIRISLGNYYEKSKSVAVILSMLQTTILMTTYVYWQEYSSRKVFAEKQNLYEETQTFREILDQTTDGIIIHSIQGKVLFKNSILKWWNNFQPADQNLSRIRITQRKNLKDLTKIKESFSSLSTGLRSDDPINNSNLNILVENLREDYRKKLISEAEKLGQSKHKTENLMELGGRVEAEPEDGEEAGFFDLKIRVLYLVFKEEPSIALIISDVTESNLIITLQDNNSYKNRLLASVSHELRTPLNASINFIRMATEDPEVPKEVKEHFLNPSLVSNQLLLHLINDILDFSQMSANKLRLVYENRKIEGTITECVDLVRLQAVQKGLDILTFFDIESIDSKFYTDHNRLKQIILNLLSNAIKFTIQGKITLSIGLRAVESKYWSTKNYKKVLHVSVEDTGIGMEPEGTQKLFKAFEKIELGDRVALNSTGVGLGLVISNNLVLMLNSDDGSSNIQVESQPNKGSKFWFSITSKDHPLAGTLSSENENYDDGLMSEASEAIDTLRTKHAHSRNPLASYSTKLYDTYSIQNLLDPNSCIELTSRCTCAQILIVDDDMFNISALEAVLKRMDLKCDSAFNGRQAVSKVEARKCQTKCSEKQCSDYQAIFMDCSMPILDGFEAAKILTSKMRSGEINEIPIIACTASPKDDEKLKAFQAGMKFHCIKPLSSDSVRKVLKQALSG